MTATEEIANGLDGVVAFATEIAEPDRAGGSLRYRGYDVEDLVGRVPFEQVWGLLVDGSFERGLPPAEPLALGHRSRRGRRAVGRGRRAVRPAARQRPRAGAADAPGRRGERRRRPLRQGGAGPRRAADGLRPPRVPGGGPARPRAAPDGAGAGR